MTEYSLEFALDVLLSDGAAVRLRPIRPDDAEREKRFFSRVSAESAYWRFFHVKQNLSPEEIRHLTTVDYEERMALIALDEDEMVGVARYDIIPGASHRGGRIAELAMLVQDSFQGRGLGHLLLNHLAAAARQHGITAFEAHVLPDNHPMFGLIRSCGLTAAREPELDVYTIDLTIPGRPGSKATT